MTSYSNNFKSSPIVYFFKFNKESTEEDIKILMSNLFQYAPLRRFEISYNGTIIDGVSIQFVDSYADMYLTSRDVLLFIVELSKPNKIDKIDYTELLKHSKFDKKLAQKLEQSNINIQSPNPNFGFELDKNRYTIVNNKKEI